MLKEFIFEESTDFNGCHAATIADTGDGKLLAVWFAGSHEGNDDVAIWGSHYSGQCWRKPQKFIKVSQEPHWNPVLFNDGCGKLHLYFKVGNSIPDWRTWHMLSWDNGITWEKPEELVPGDKSGGRGPVKNKPIMLDNGNIIAPGSIEKKGLWQAFADLSCDGGITWTKSNLISLLNPAKGVLGIIQPTLWESRPGSIHMLLRSNCGKICRSDSSDGGRNWSDAYPIALPNNSSGIDLAKLPDGRLVLICNPISDVRVRTPLSIMLSSDNGKNWDKFCDIEDDNVKVGNIVKQDGGEFSYPSIIYCNGKISAVYTWHRKRICFWQMTFDELLGLLPSEPILAGG